MLLPTHTKPPANPDRRAFGLELTPLHVPHEDLLKPADSVVVVFNEFRESSHPTADVNACGRIGHSHAIKDAFEGGVALALLRNTSDCQGPSVEGLEVLRRSKPGMAKSDHRPPVKPNTDDNEDGDAVGDDNMCAKEVAFDVSNGEHTEEVAFLCFHMLEIVDDIEGNEDATG